METDDNIDVRGLLRQVQMPTLVVHCDRDHVVSPKYGCQMAAEISNARYVSLPSANHLLLAEEPAWRIFLKSLEHFLNGTQMLRSPHERFLIPHLLRWARVEFLVSAHVPLLS